MIFGLAVNPQSGIKTFADVKGKDVALATESWSSLLAPIFSGAGMSVSDVNMVSYGDGRYEAVASNSAPVLGTWLSEYCQLPGSLLPRNSKHKLPFFLRRCLLPKRKYRAQCLHCR